MEKIGLDVCIGYFSHVSLRCFLVTRVQVTRQKLDVEICNLMGRKGLDIYIEKLHTDGIKRHGDWRVCLYTE